jgi:hypothetical protein
LHDADERAFGKRRLFADSPTASALGFGIRVGDPALPLLKPEARLATDAKRLLRSDILHALPDPTAQWDAPNGHFWIRRVLGLMFLIAVMVGLSFYRKEAAETRQHLSQVQATNREPTGDSCGVVVQQHPSLAFSHARNFNLCVEFQMALFPLILNHVTASALVVLACQKSTW